MKKHRRHPSALTIGLVLLVLLFGWAGVTLHQHADGDVHHSCAVCGAAHHAAVPLASLGFAAPRPLARHGVAVATARAPRDAFRGTHYGRAPPASS